ncbi:MAG: hypothetical protein IKR73_09055 [Oscillospiraceae bacterium]|nr:hypothetical protein [Oscillospiraceae bacterium]
MYDDTERAFVERCIVNDRQDRLLFELGGRQRQRGIGRFCHDAEDLIRPDRVLSSGKLSREDIMALVKAHDVSVPCHIIAYDKALDKRVCTLEEALDMVLGNGMAAVILCGDIAVIETEQCFGTPMRYIALISS